MYVLLHVLYFLLHGG
jgi:vesicle transport protein SEC22